MGGNLDPDLDPDLDSRSSSSREVGRSGSDLLVCGLPRWARPDRKLHPESPSQNFPPWIQITGPALDLGSRTRIPVTNLQPGSWLHPPVYIIPVIIHQPV